MTAGGGDIGLVYIYKAEAEEDIVVDEEEREKRVAPSSNTKKHDDRLPAY